MEHSLWVEKYRPKILSNVIIYISKTQIESFQILRFKKLNFIFKYS